MTSRRSRASRSRSSGRLSAAARTSPSGGSHRSLPCSGTTSRALLGYSLRQTTPVFVQPEEHVTVERGEGTELRAFRIPSTNLEFMVATFGPRAQFADAVTHAGLDVMYVAEGALVLVVDGVDYPLREGECAVWPSSHAHTVRNDADQSARAIGFTTETVY